MNIKISESKFLEHFKKHNVPHPHCIYFKDGHVEHYLPDEIHAAVTTGPLANPTTLIGQQIANPITWSLENTTGDISKSGLESIAFALGITQWGLKLKVKFQRVPAGTPGVNVPIKFLSKGDPNYVNLFPNDNILAVTFYPQLQEIPEYAGHMYFNDDEIWTLDGKPIPCSVALAKGWATGCTDPNEMLQTYKITTVGRHEFGHALGYQHMVETKSVNDTMYPYYNINTNSLAEEEVSIGYAAYGQRTDVNPQEVANVDKLVADNASFQ